MNTTLTGTVRIIDDEHWIDGEVDERFDGLLEQIGVGNMASVTVREHNDRMVAELCIDVGGGQVVVTTDNTFEFHDCLPISIDDMKYVIDEAEAFVAYRDDRNASNGGNDHR